MAKKLKLELTQRGFARADFDDLYGSHCSVQESSLATDNAIWLGVHEGSPEYSTSFAFPAILPPSPKVCVTPRSTIMIETISILIYYWQYIGFETFFDKGGWSGVLAQESRISADPRAKLDGQVFEQSSPSSSDGGLQI